MLSELRGHTGDALGCHKAKTEMCVGATRPIDMRLCATRPIHSSLVAPPARIPGVVSSYCCGNC